MNDRVGFSTGKGLISRIIRWFTKSTVSHAWLLYLDVDFGQDMVLEATLEGVRIMPFEVFKKHNTIIKIAVPSKDLKSGLLQAGGVLGGSYDFTGLFGMLWVLFGHWLKRKWKNPWNNSQAMFCSEFVARVLMWSNYPGVEYWEPSEMTPQDLYEFLVVRESKEAALNAPIK